MFASVVELKPVIQFKSILSIFVACLFFVIGCGGGSSSDSLPPDDEGSDSIGEGDNSIPTLDDFSLNTLRFSLDESIPGQVENTYKVLNDQVEMTSERIVDVNAQAEFRVWRRSDSISARVSLSDQSILAATDNSGARIGLSGPFYNDIQDGGVEGALGDVVVQSELRLNNDGSRSAIFCFFRLLGDDWSQESLNIVNGDNCGDFFGFVPELNTPYTLSISLDRIAGVISLSLNEIVREIDIGTPVYLPHQDWRSVRLRSRGTPSKAVGSVFSISTDNFTQDFSVEPLQIRPYRHLWNMVDGVRSITTTEDERARFDVASIGPREQFYLALKDEVEAIKSDIELSSESQIVAESAAEQNSYAQIRLGGTFYNDTAEGGFNEKEGDVFAGIGLRARGDGSRTLFYCVFRSNSAANFEDPLNLINPGDDDCPDFGFVPELDKAYSAKIRLNRNPDQFVFTLDNIEKTVDITTPVFAPEDQFLGIQTSSSGGSRAIAYADNFGALVIP